MDGENKRFLEDSTRCMKRRRGGEEMTEGINNVERS